MSVRLRVPDVDDPDFAADVRYDPIPVMQLVGSADQTTARALGELIATVHGELIARAATELVLDLLAVDIMATACFRELVVWLTRLRDLPANERYRIRLRWNPAISWQRYNLYALSCFDTDLIAAEP